MTDVTRSLSQVEQGDALAAEKLLPLVYDELRKLAAAKLAQEKPGHTLQATALVHEAYLRLVGPGVGGQESGVGGQRTGARGRGHEMKDAQAGQSVPSTQYSVLSASAEAAATIPPSPHDSPPPAAPSLPPDLPSEPTVQPQAASRPAQPQPITPAPVTDEEIAALLESALTPHPLRVAETAYQPTADSGSTFSQPRRRNLPRRSEAA